MLVAVNVETVLPFGIRTSVALVDCVNYEVTSVPLSVTVGFADNPLIISV